MDRQTHINSMPRGYLWMLDCSIPFLLHQTETTNDTHGHAHMKCEKEHSGQEVNETTRLTKPSLCTLELRWWWWWWRLCWWWDCEFNRSLHTSTLASNWIRNQFRIVISNNKIVACRTHFVSIQLEIVTQHHGAPRNSLQLNARSA